MKKPIVITFQQRIHTRYFFDTALSFKRVLVIFFLMGIALCAGGTLAHMQIKAVAIPSPYQFAGSSIKMKITTCEIIAETPLYPVHLPKNSSTMLSRTLGSYFSTSSLQNTYSSESGNAVQGKIDLTVFTPPPNTNTPTSASAGLIHLGNGTVGIVTSNGVYTVSAKQDIPFLQTYPKGAYATNDSLSPRALYGKDFTSLFAASPAYFECRLLPKNTMGQSSSFSQRFKHYAEQKTLNTRISVYKALAKQYGKKYNLTPELIVAIIHTESNFNPLAASSSQALGLMQIVPETAGEEVYAYLNGINGTPSQDLLFQPEHNVKYGTVYLHLLNTRYFQGVVNEASRNLCIVTAYNGGPGAVIRVFNQNHAEAIALINTMTPDQVYTELTTKMPRQESRLYVDKVLGRMHGYSTVMN